MTDLVTMASEEGQRPGTERLPVSALWQTCVTQTESCETQLPFNNAML